MPICAARPLLSSTAEARSKSKAPTAEGGKLAEYLPQASSISAYDINVIEMNKIENEVSFKKASWTLN